MSIPGIQSIGIRGIRDAIVAPSEVRAVVVYKPRSQCCDFIVSCFLTCVLYFFVYFFYIPLTVQCESDDSSVQVEGWYYGLDIMDFGDLVLSIVIAGAGYYFVWECWSSSDWLVSPRQTAIYVMCPSDHDIWIGTVWIWILELPSWNWWEICSHMSSCPTCASTHRVERG